MFGKYDTETYSMTTFDLRGSKIAKVALGNIGLIRSLEIGREVVNQGDAHSFVIERVCFNSLDHADLGNQNQPADMPTVNPIRRIHE